MELYSGGGSVNSPYHLTEDSYGTEERTDTEPWFSKGLRQVYKTTALQTASELEKSPHTLSSGLGKTLNPTRVYQSHSDGLSFTSGTGKPSYIVNSFEGSDSTKVGEWLGNGLKKYEDGRAKLEEEVYDTIKNTPSNTLAKAKGALNQFSLGKQTDGVLSGNWFDSNSELSEMGIRKKVKSKLSEIGLPEQIRSFIPFGRTPKDIVKWAHSIKSADFIGRFSTKIAGAVGRSKKFVDDVMRRSLPGVLDIALWANQMKNAYRKQETGKISERKMKIKMGRVTGGLVGGLLGGGLGAVATGGNPVGAIAGSIIGEMAGKPAGGAITKKFFTSSKKSKSATVTTQSSTNSSRANITEMKRGMDSAHSIATNSSESTGLTSGSGTASYGELPIAPLEPVDASVTDDTDTSMPKNRAKENKRARSGPQIVNQEVRVDPSSIADVDRKIEEAKQEAIREMENRVGPRPSPF
ncbi:hypothetical protein [Halorussus sp. MSC15.2]|uniref:hypothetical protein n=1 Tax=Halorussus sp. MSC15.2 TaxID=2283638 RepID=UPI0013D209AF|nr:hypothetical protein [Halorussus sp. MSC15.2]NEU57100.1 hypothetical protein [Halorussus sp. MSC15.2]